MTHCERVLDLLRDGDWHSHLELYALHVVAHSRVSDLRRRGHVIEQRREGDLYLYRLVGGLDGGETVSTGRGRPWVDGTVLSPVEPVPAIPLPPNGGGLDSSTLDTLHGNVGRLERVPEPGDGASPPTAGDTLNPQLTIDLGAAA